MRSRRKIAAAPGELPSAGTPRWAHQGAETRYPGLPYTHGSSVHAQQADIPLTARQRREQPGLKPTAILQPRSRDSKNAADFPAEARAPASPTRQVYIQGRQRSPARTVPTNADPSRKSRSARGHRNPAMSGPAASPRAAAPGTAACPPLPAAGHGTRGRRGGSAARPERDARGGRRSAEPVASPRPPAPRRSSLAEPPRGRGGPSRSRAAGHRRAGPRVPRPGHGPASPHLVRIRAASSPRRAAPAGLAAQRGADSPAGSLSSCHHLPPAAAPAASTARHGPSRRSAPPFASARPPPPSWSRGGAGRCRHDGPRRWEARRWRPPGRAALRSAGCPNAPGERGEPGPEPEPAAGRTMAARQPGRGWIAHLEPGAGAALPAQRRAQLRDGARCRRPRTAARLRRCPAAHSVPPACREACCPAVRAHQCRSLHATACSLFTRANVALVIGYHEFGENH